MAYNEPWRIKEAKKKAAGPLGHQMASFPLRFAVPAFFADIPTKGQRPLANNGTITLMKFDKKLLGVTCFHVIDAYRKQLVEDPGRIFQIGDARIRPLERLIDESRDLDLATLDLTGLKTMDITLGREHNFFEPARWPPSPIASGEFVALAGFPGVWRKHPAHLEVSFASFSLGATMVTDVGQRTIVCSFEREYWIQSLGPRMAADLTDFGGLSGGPVFNLSGLAAELVGLVSEYSTADDYLLIRPSRFIQKDGSINKE